MAYATRSSGSAKAPFPSRSLKHSPVLLKTAESSIINKRYVAKTRRWPITTDDTHPIHPKDGIDHHVLEQDGRNHHHIWFRDFAENGDGPQVHGNQQSLLIHIDHRNRPKSLDGQDHHEVESDGRDHHHIRYGLSDDKSFAASEGHPRPIENKASGHHIRFENSTAEMPLRDGKDHHLIERDGRDHHHVRYDVSDADASSMDVDRHASGQQGLFSGSDISSTEKLDQSTSRTERARAFFSSFLFPKATAETNQASDTVIPGSAPKEITTSSTPNHTLGGVTQRRDSHLAATRHYQGSDGTVTTTTTTTTNKISTDKQLNHRARDEALTRSLKEKSQADRQKARDAILSLDNDVVLLQKLLQEKENALREVEARASQFQQITVRTETLTHEIHDLEITIHDLRNTLKSKEKALKESHHQHDQVHKKSQEHQKHLEEEIAKLSGDLKSKEQAQEHSKVLQKSLDQAHAQRAQLTAEFRHLGDRLQVREADLKAAHTAIKDLENEAAAHTKETERTRKELSRLKKSLDEHEHELKHYQHKIKALEGAQDKAHSLESQLRAIRVQLVESEARSTKLEKANKALSKDGVRAAKLEDQIRSLKAGIKEHETQLSEALRSTKDLDTYRERVRDLECELQDLREQVDVQEKHLTFLEDALQAHENYAFEVQQLQGHSKELKHQLREKETEIQSLTKANKSLDEKDGRIQTLQSEIQRILQEMDSKDKNTLKLKEKMEADMTKVRSSASSLETEVESLHQQLRDKSRDLAHAEKNATEVATEKDRAMALTVEITRLEKMISDKDHQLADVSKIMEIMKDRVQKADRLEGKVKDLRKDVLKAEKVADLSAKDLAAASSTASKLVVQVESLREQLAQKEKEISVTESSTKELEQKSIRIKELVVKISELEEKSQRHQYKSQEAEEKVKALEADIKTVEFQLNKLQGLLDGKEAALLAARDKASKDSEMAMKNLLASQGTVAYLKKQLKEVEKETKAQVKAKQDQIHALHKDLQRWEGHEEGWLIKTADLTGELSRGTDVLRLKKKALQDLQLKLEQKNLEIGRLNEVVNDARGALRADRKRRASEVAERVKDKTQHLQSDKATLNKKITELQGQVTHLDKKVRLDHDHVAKELELAEIIRELTFWKQTSTEQTKEWETTVLNLVNEKERNTATLIQYEGHIRSIRSKLDDTDAWRQRAIGQAEQLAGMILKLEKELSMLKAVLAHHDANDVKISERSQSLADQIEILEEKKDDMHRQVRAKEAQIVELEERLRGDINSYKARLGDVRRELVLKDKKIELLNSRIAEYTRHNAELESRVVEDKDSLLALEDTLIRLRSTLAAQMEKYKALDEKYKAAIVIQTEQDKQLQRVEKKLENVSAEDSEKHHQLQTTNRGLLKEMESALRKVDGLEVEIHNVTRSYHEALVQVKDAQSQMAMMVPAENASHEACAARVHAGEKEVAKLSSRIVDLKAKASRVTKEQSAREGEWSRTVAGLKDRILLMSKSQHVLEAQLRDAEKARDQERADRERDRIHAEREKRAQDETILSFQRSSMQMKKEYSVLETRMRREMSTTKELAELLAKLRHSIKRDSEAELRSLDELEKELKSRESVVGETIRLTRRRMDSGAFLETNEAGVAR